MLPEAANFKKGWQRAQAERRGHEAVCAFVYAHFEEDSERPFYVGIGNVARRPWDAAHRTLKHRHKAEKHGYRAAIVADGLNWELAKWWEVRWIKALRNAGYDLVNLTDGGDGTLGYRRSNEERELFRQINQRPDIMAGHKDRMTLRNPMRDPEVAEKVAEQNRGRRASEETRAKMSAVRKGVRKTEAQKAASGEGVRRAWERRKRLLEKGAE